MAKQKVQVPISFYVDREALERVITGAHAAYWLEEYRTTYSARHKRLTVGMLRVPVSGFDAVPVNSVVGYDTIAEAIAEALSGGDANKAAARFCAGEADGPDMDAILQRAVFGRVVYG